MKFVKSSLLSAAAIVLSSQASAVDLEVTHWWTSGGEAAAVAEFARAFNDKTEHNWVDGAIAGSGGTAWRPWNGRWFQRYIEWRQGPPIRAALL